MQPRYGLMPEHDYDTLDKTLDLVLREFPEGVINTLEIGVHRGNGSRGIHKFISDRGRINFHTGIDNQHDLQVTPPFEGCHIIIGNSMEIYNKVHNNSQHFILVDGNHSLPMTIIDTFVYAPKLKTGGLMALHDTGAQIKPHTDYQYMGDRDDEDMYISCRKAAQELGLLRPKSTIGRFDFELVFDEYDVNFPTGGLLVIRKVN
jgi:hypothetical protein